MKKFYIASGIQNRFYASCVSKLIRDKFLNVECTSTWIEDFSTLEVAKRAEIDFGDIDRSDIVVAIYPYGRNGTICEMTYAFTKCLPVVYCCTDKDQKDAPLITGLFEPHKKTNHVNIGFICTTPYCMLNTIHSILGVEWRHPNSQY